MESGNGEFALDVSEAYNRLQIGASGPNLPDETVLTYYQSLSSGAPSGSKDSFAEALRTIALHRDSIFLLRKLDDPNAVVHASTAEPVGLDNIGNTCYLNSLLQYYYTIKPVRDMVIDFEKHCMTLSEDNLKIKRVGGRIVDKSEIIKAQKCKRDHYLNESCMLTFQSLVNFTICSKISRRHQRARSNLRRNWPS
tara:strand:+ start:1920 stop:2504 length:585 start_codon:yes stop_codon:yes gene_type:complete